MNHKTILISGATGFIGSHITEELLNNDFIVVALIREESNLWRLNNFNSKNLHYVYLFRKNYIDEVRKFNPTLLIHSAWQGINNFERNDWMIQFSNLSFTLELLILSSELNIKKVIAFGSQAEYGNFEGRINEDSFCEPQTAYGTAKHITQIAIKKYCEVHNINWIWLRIFSLFGEKDNDFWLLPTVINNLLSRKATDLTASEQKYDFMYVKNLAKAVIKIINQNSVSNIYNLSSNTSIKLKDLIELIRSKIDPSGVINYNAIPYRKNQIMHLEGDSTKFITEFKFSLESNFNAINDVINYYKLNSSNKNEGN